MTIETFLSPKTFTGYLQLAHESEWTGRIDISASENPNQLWSIYLIAGQLIWCSGGAHQQRRWRRFLHQYCPHIPVKETSTGDPANYYQLGQWVEMGLLMPARAKTLLKDNCAEVFFDILQQESKGQLTFKTSTANQLTTYLPPIDFNQALNYSKDNWNYWCEAGLEHISPNHVVALTQAQQKQLQKQVNFQLYQELIRVIDGEKSLRDIALLLRQPLLSVGVSFFTLFRQGLVEMYNIPDLPLTDVLIPLSTSFKITVEDLLSNSVRLCSKCGCDNSTTAFLCQKCKSPLAVKALPAKPTTRIYFKSIIPALLLVLATGGGYFVWHNWARNSLQQTLVPLHLKTSKTNCIH